MQDKEKLSKLLDIITELIKQKGNEWMVEDLLLRLNQTIKVGANPEILNDIYEYCVEEIIKKQATEFYHDFPFPEIKNTLIADYVRMERFKRQDNFEDFCLALYQQIECITNTIIKDKALMEIAPKLMTYPAYVIEDDFSKRNLDSDYCVAKLIFLKNPDEKYLENIINLYAIDKIRVIMYFICYKTILRNTDYKYFVEYGDLIYSLYQYRNKNHRGDIYNEAQNEIFAKIEPLKSYYYLKFSTFLIFYIEGIKKGYPIDKDLISYCMKLEDRKYTNSLKVIGRIDVSSYSNKNYFKKNN